MYEFGIRNVKTDERNIIFGYSWRDAVRRSKLTDEENWEIDYKEYID